MNNCRNITKPKTRVYNHLAKLDLLKELPQTISDQTVFFPRHFLLNNKKRYLYTDAEGNLVFDPGKKTPLSWETVVNRELIESVSKIYGMVLPADTKIVEFIYPAEGKTKYIDPYVKFNEDILTRIEKFAYEYPQELVPPQMEESNKLEPDDFTEAESPSPSISPTLKIDEKGQYRMFQNVSDEGLLAAEKTIRDLAARMSDRIGIPFQIISDRTQEFKGKIENETAIINLAYASLDTPIHEILGHPIIRAIKQNTNYSTVNFKVKKGKEDYLVEISEKDGWRSQRLKNLEKRFTTKEEAENYKNKLQQSDNQLYQNLLKELEYGKGKEVLDRIKRDYKYKSNYYIVEDTSWGDTSYNVVIDKSVVSGENSFKTKEEAEKRLAELSTPYTLEEQQEEAIVELLGLYTAGRLDATKDLKLVSLLKQLLGRIKAFVRDLLFQKEVEIDKLPDNMTIGDLADLLAYSNNKLILPGNEVVYTTPDNQKFKTYAEASKHISDLAKNLKDVDLSDISLERKLSQEDLQKIQELEKQKQEKENYFNSKKYQQDKGFELYKLNKKLEELKNKKVDFYSQEPFLDLEDKEKYGFQDFDYIRVESTYFRGNEYHKDILGENYEGYYIHGYNTSTGKPKKKILPITKEQAIEIWQKDESSKYEVGDRQEIFRTEDSIRYLQEDSKIKYEISSIEQEIKNIKAGQNTIQNFIEKNKEYEQSKEIIEEWKRVNNIQYNPEEIYSRGQEFTSVVGAYSNFDVNLMMQNLLQHIEDNEKAGGEFTISAFTKPIDKNIRHLEEGGGKIKFKIYPKSKDIKWAANTDVYSGSTTINGMSASKAVSSKSSELVGVSFLKYPSLNNINSVQPNLASIVDNLAHHHNELGITLTGNNFRLEYDEDIPYTTKKIIDSVNSILDQKYGKLQKPKTQKGKKQTILVDNPLPENERSGVLSYSSDYGGGYFLDTLYGYEQRGYAFGNRIPYFKALDILKVVYPNSEVTLEPITSNVLVDGKNIVSYSGLKYSTPSKIEKQVIGIQPTQTNETLKESINSVREKLNENNLQDEDMPFAPKEQRKEYTSQALINTKIVALKEVAKKYPRSLIRSEVRPIGEIGFRYEDVFQKIPSTSIKPGVPELFESNPELANSVYEALGYETIPVGWEKGKTLYDKAKPVKIDFKSGITTLPNGNYLVRAYRTDDTGLGSKGYGQRGEGLYLSLTNPYPGKNVNTVEFEISPSDIITYKEEFSRTIPYEKLTEGKGNFQDRVALAGGKAFIGGINSSEDPNLEIVLYDKTLINKALQSKKKVSNFTTKYLLYDLITPQQKQQAQQLYSDYLDTTQNQFISPNDRVVFGHPTIGKSFLKKQGEDKFITLDDDYANEVNAFVDANRGTETRQEYKGRKPKEYNEFMLNLYDRLKAQAQREGKILFVSNTNILKERMSDFDKVITIPKAEFKRRFDERGATYGFEDWKSDIDATVAKVPNSKVITTTGYLADLFRGSQQDIEGFKEFVEQPSATQPTVSDVSSISSFKPRYEMTAEEREQRFQDFYNENQNISEEEAREYFNRCMI